MDLQAKAKQDIGAAKHRVRQMMMAKRMGGQDAQGLMAKQDGVSAAPAAGLGDSAAHAAREAAKSGANSLLEAAKSGATSLLFKRKQPKAG